MYLVYTLFIYHPFVPECLLIFFKLMRHNLKQATGSYLLPTGIFLVAEYILLPQPPNPPPPRPQLGLLANERAVSSDVMLLRSTFWSGKFAPLSSRSLARYAPSIYDFVIHILKSNVWSNA